MSGSGRQAPEAVFATIFTREWFERGLALGVLRVVPSSSTPTGPSMPISFRNEPTADELLEKALVLLPENDPAVYA